MKIVSNNLVGKSCPIPIKIPNGFNKFSSFLHGSKAIYQCFNGFEMTKGDKELKCHDGTWIGVVPTCTKVNCGFPGQIANGRILYIGTLAEYTYQPYMTTVGQNKQIRYECDKGIFKSYLFVCRDCQDNTVLSHIRL